MSSATKNNYDVITASVHYCLWECIYRPIMHSRKWLYFQYNNSALFTQEVLESLFHPGVLQCLHIIIHITNILHHYDVHNQDPWWWSILFQRFYLSWFQVDHNAIVSSPLSCRLEDRIVPLDAHDAYHCAEGRHTRA